MLEDGIEWESFTIISIDQVLVFEHKYYLQVYWYNCAYKIVDKQMTDYLDVHLFEIDKDQIFLILINESYKFYITIELI